MSYRARPSVGTLLTTNILTLRPRLWQSWLNLILSWLCQHWLRLCLLSGGTKPLPESILTYHQRGPVTITWENFTRDTLVINYWNYLESYTYIKFHSNFPGPNEFYRPRTSEYNEQNRISDLLSAAIAIETPNHHTPQRASDKGRRQKYKEVDHMVLID